MSIYGEMFEKAAKETKKGLKQFAIFMIILFIVCVLIAFGIGYYFASH